MSNERPDEFAAWRRCLRQPDALPEQGLPDKDAAWDRLFDRLSETPRRRFQGSRIVAACILILLIPAARLFQRHPTPGGMHPATPQRVAPIASAPAGRPPHAVPITRPKPALPLQRRQPGRSLPAATARTATSTHTPEGLVSPAPAFPVPSAMILARPAIGPPPVTGYLQQPQRPAIKKEWKVVDLNEIDPGRQRTHGMAANRQPANICIGVGIGKAGSAATTTPPPEEDTRLKINLATQNR